MKALHATPQNIQEIFTRTYIIPEYQRPYSWKKDECEQLWEDLHDFVESNQDGAEKYFLGSIVLYEENDNYYVVDGQQRLISLSLLLRAIFEKVMSFDKLERCLFIFDDESGNNTGELRLKSEVIEEEENSLSSAITRENINPESLYEKNYNLFSGIINNWLDTLGTTERRPKLVQFINTTLNKVVLLPIKCEERDDALTIFETINNRGMSLSDTDIFKATLHKNASIHHKEFIKRWNELGNKYDDIFRIYMYILRAKDQITEKEIALRSFFLLPAKPRLSNWKNVIEDLERVDACISYHWEDCPDIESCEECIKYPVCKWFQILTYYPNQYWQYPIYTYLFKNIDENGELPAAKVKKYSELLQETVRYCYVKSIIYNSVNVIKDTIFKVCAQIWAGNRYASTYHEGLSKDNSEIEFSLNSGKFQRSLRGICFLHAYLNPEQEFIPWEAHIEHILPKKWNNYDGWTEETYQADVNRLGNLVVLEKRLNISAKNEFFSRKKQSYENSDIIEANDLCDIPSWTPDTLAERHERVVEELTAFLRTDN